MGIYFICSRIAVLMNVFLTVISSHNSPALAKLIVNGNHADAIEIMSFTSRILAFISVPLVFLVIVFGSELLSLWNVNESFIIVLEILFIGRFFNVLTGNIGKYMIYSEKKHVEVMNNTISIILMVVLIVGLVPSYGVVGAAIANALVLIVLNVIKYLEFKKFFSLGFIGLAQVYYFFILVFSYIVMKLAGGNYSAIQMSICFILLYIGFTAIFVKKDVFKYLSLIDKHNKNIF